jgi:hypothetical protein
LSISVLEISELMFVVVLEIMSHCCMCLIESKADCGCQMIPSTTWFPLLVTMTMRLEYFSEAEVLL